MATATVPTLERPTAKQLLLSTARLAQSIRPASGSGIRDVGQVGNLQRIGTDKTWYHWGDNASPYANGYITPTYNSSSSTVNWNGPC